ncbi:MAG: nucleoside diphosphate kinase regulator [Bdellovibrionales bacterium]|nr:nucleoside diphosphate kinase regulator [Bdellovibrionales bacterium]
MEDTNALILNEQDYEKISALVARIGSDQMAAFEEELGRATIVPEEQLPKDVVAMGTKVRFIDLDSQKESEVTLVYPQDANIEANKVSVLAPVGSALIGLRVGQKIKWPMPNGKTVTLQVNAVEQP